MPTGACAEECAAATLNSMKRWRKCAGNTSLAAMPGNLRQGCWYGRISLHAICKHANSIACDRHWMAFRGLGVFKGWQGIRAWWEICLVKQSLLLRNRSFINFNKNLCEMPKKIDLCVSLPLLCPFITPPWDLSATYFWLATKKNLTFCPKSHE